MEAAAVVVVVVVVGVVWGMGREEGRGREEEVGAVEREAENPTHDHSDPNVVKPNTGTNRPPLGFPFLNKSFDVPQQRESRQFACCPIQPLFNGRSVRQRPASQLPASLLVC